MAADVCYGVPLDHSVDISILGIGFHFETNSDAMLGIVEEAYGCWRSLDDRPEYVTAQRARVRIVVHNSHPGVSENIPMTYRLPDPGRLFVHTLGSFAYADASTAESIAYVSPELMQHTAYFQHAMLSALVLMLVSSGERQPVHAAAIGRGGAVLLLVGPMGVGKSTLTYAACRAGCRLLSDDVVFVQLEPAPRIWGNPGPVLLPVEARQFFQELEDAEPSVLLPMGHKIPARPEWLGGLVLPPVVDQAGVCLVSSEKEGPALQSMSASELEQTMLELENPGINLYSATLPPAVKCLAATGGWILRLPRDPNDAVPLLLQLLDDLNGRGDGKPAAGG